MIPTKKQAQHSDQVLWDSLNYSSKDGDKKRRIWLNTDQSDVKCDSTLNENVMKMKPTRLKLTDRLQPVKNTSVLILLWHTDQVKPPILFLHMSQSYKSGSHRHNAQLLNTAWTPLQFNPITGIIAHYIRKSKNVTGS